MSMMYQTPFGGTLADENPVENKNAHIIDLKIIFLHNVSINLLWDVFEKQNT